MLPQTQFVFPGELMPDAPADTYNALGKNDQLINVSPSEGLVLVRMGNAAEESVQVSAYFNNIIWQYMNELECNTGITDEGISNGIALLPNPARSTVKVSIPSRLAAVEIEVVNAMGQTVLSASGTADLNVANLTPGVYLVKVATSDGRLVSRLVKE